MRDDPNLKASGKVVLSVSMDGWTALVPCGYSPGTLVMLLSVMGMSAFAMLLLSVMGFMIFVSLPLGLMALYAFLLHGHRGVRSTRLDVRGSTLRIQRRVLGADRGEHQWVSLVGLPPSTIEGGVEKQTLSIGEHRIPVHAAEEDLERLLTLLEESRRLAEQDGQAVPVPTILQAMRSTHT